MILLLSTLNFMLILQDYRSQFDKVTHDIHFSLSFQIILNHIFISPQNELQQVKRSTAEHIKQNTFEQLQYGALLEQRRQYKEIMKKFEARKQVSIFSLFLTVVI